MTYYVIGFILRMIVSGIYGGLISSVSKIPYFIRFYINMYKRIEYDIRIHQGLHRPSNGGKSTL